MEISRKSCRLCLSETEFNVSLFGSYGQRTNIVEKIFVCLKLVIEENEIMNTICYKCAENVERYHNFFMFINKSQTKLIESKPKVESSSNRRRLITSIVHEKVYDADYTFSFLDNMEENVQPKASSPFFSYFSPPNMLVKRQTEEEPVWKTPNPRREERIKSKSDDQRKRPRDIERQKHHSRDLFESQSQDVDEDDFKTMNWRLTPDDNIIKRVRDKCFGRSDY